MAEWSDGRGIDRSDANDPAKDPEHTRSPTTTGPDKTSGLTVARQEYNLDRGKRIDGSDRVQITPAADTAAPENPAPTAPEQAKRGKRVEADPSGDPRPDPTPEPHRGETSPSDTESRHNEPETVHRHHEAHAPQQEQPGQSDRAQITPIAPVSEAEGAEVDVSPAEAPDAHFHTEYTEKILGQLETRGWTKDMVERTIRILVSETHLVWDLTSGTRQPATAYALSDNQYVVVNDVTNEIVQVSDRNIENWKPVWESETFKR
jgi:Colicin E5 ribonuclease domain